MKALLNQTKTLLAAFAVSVGLGGTALAQDNVATNDVDATQASIDYRDLASLDGANAEIESQGRILLHFGEGFPEHIKEAVQILLEKNNYNFIAVEGGPENMMDLYINGQKGKKPFAAADSIGILLSVLDRHASQYRFAELNLPTNEAG